MERHRSTEAGYKTQRKLSNNNRYGISIPHLHELSVSEVMGILQDYDKSL